MALIGIYSQDVEEAQKPMEDRTVTKVAAYDTDTEEWTETSRGTVLRVIYPEYFDAKRDEGTDAVLEYLREEFESHGTFVELESDVSATIEVDEPVQEPDEIELGENAPEWRYDLDE